MSMDRLENDATPLIALTVNVPDSVPPPGLVVIAKVMAAVEPVTVPPPESWTATFTGGDMLTPAVVVGGCPVARNPTLTGVCASATAGDKPTNNGRRSFSRRVGAKTTRPPREARV